MKPDGQMNRLYCCVSADLKFQIVPILVEVGPVYLSRVFFTKVVNVFSLRLYYLFLEKSILPSFKQKEVCYI